MKRLRVYADTSVFGGCFDAEFEADSRALFSRIAAREFVLVISFVTLRELNQAPAHVQRVLADLPPDAVEVVADWEEVWQLRDPYLAAGVVSASCAADAEHIAAATVSGVDVVVSWNFRQMVHFDKIRQYGAVNLLWGCRPLAIHSPKEVV